MFSEVTDNFLGERSVGTQKSYKLRMERWCLFLGCTFGSEESEYAVCHAKPGDARRFMELEQKRPGRDGRTGQKGRATATQKVTVAVLHCYYERLVAHGFLRSNPWAVERSTRWRKVIEKRPTQAIPFDAVKKILDLPDNSFLGRRDRAILSLLFGGGLRRSEVTNLKLNDIRKTVKGKIFIRLRETKTEPEHGHAIPQWVIDAVSEWARYRVNTGAQGNDFLFSSYLDRGKISDATVYLTFKRYIQKAGLDPDDFSPHSARATAITKLLSDGEDYRSVQEFSRLASVQMVELYDKRFLGVEKSPGNRLRY